MTTASIVARQGWIIPAPFAIPPTVKPPRARPPASGPCPSSGSRRPRPRRRPRASAAAASSRPAAALDRQRHADHAGREHEHLLGRELEQLRRRARPSPARRAAPGSPVAALAIPALTTTACGSAALEVPPARRRPAPPARGSSVNIAAPTAGRASGRARGRGRCLPDPRSGRRSRRSPSAAVTLIRAPRRGAGRRSPRSPSARFALWTAWPAAPLPRLSSAQMTIARPSTRPRRGRSRRCRCPGRARARGDALRQHAYDGVARHVRGLEPRRGGRPRAARVAGRDQPAAHGQQVRDEADREAERLLDLGRVLVRADAVRRDVLEHEAGVRAAFSVRPAPETPDFASITTLPGRSRRRAARARAAPRSRSSPGSRSGGPRAAELGQRVAPAPSSSGRGCAKPYQRSYSDASCSRCAPERSTTTAPAGGSSAAASPWSRQRKIRSAPARERGLVRDEARGRPPFRRGSSAAASCARERVGAERDELEPGVSEHAVERLLTGVAGGAEDRGGRHRRSMPEAW